jgi:hypothetical protein
MGAECKPEVVTGGCFRSSPANRKGRAVSRYLLKRESLLFFNLCITCKYVNDKSKMIQLRNLPMPCNEDRRRARRWQACLNESLLAPHLLGIEVVQVLRRLVFERLVPLRRAEEAVRDLEDLRINPHFVLLPRIWQLRSNFSGL